MKRNGTVQLLDFAPGAADFAADVCRGLSQPRKRLPAKYFYDRYGSELFEQICELPEYYLTRAELATTRHYAADMAAHLGPRCALIEYGSGSSLKTDALLDQLVEPAAYIPIDISRAALLEAAERVAAKYRAIDVLPVCADYTRRFTLPTLAGGCRRKVVYFPGSTIGNFHPRQAVRFLSRVRKLIGRCGGLLIGVDLVKEPQLLHAAYNDAAGTTAAFNVNVLARINRELGGNFRLHRFAHYAFYNPRAGRIEMHLVSLCDQVAHAAGELFHFREGESIFTEGSYKYTLDGFENLAAEAGLSVERIWLDAERLFSVQYLEVR